MVSWHLFKKFLFSKQASSLTRTIAWLCVSSIGFGVFALILVSSVMGGFGQSIEKRLLAAEPHLVVWKNDDQKKTEKNSLEKWNRSWEKLQTEILIKYPGLQTYQFEKQDLLIRTIDGFYRGVEARGVEKEALEYILYEVSKESDEASGIKLDDEVDDVENLRGNTREKVELELIPGEIFIGLELADVLGIYVEDELSILSPNALLLPSGEVPSFDTVTVKGFLSTTIEKIDRQTFYYIKGQSLDRLGENLSKKEGVEIRLPDPLEFEEIYQEIKNHGFLVESWKDRNSSLFWALKLEKIAITLFLILGTLVAGFSIVTILILLMTQKKREIGILLAMGMTKQRIRKVFTIIGVFLSVIGGGVGLFLGLSFSMYIEKNPLTILPDLYIDNRVTAKVDLEFIFIAAGVALILSIFTSWFASRKVSELNLVEVIRQKR